MKITSRIPGLSRQPGRAAVARLRERILAPTRLRRLPSRSQQLPRDTDLDPYSSRSADKTRRPPR